MKENPSVNLCVIATNYYRKFLWPLLESARMYFCVELKRTFHVWMDQPQPWPEKLAKYPVPIIAHYLPHEPWPGITLHRYRTFLADAPSLEETGDFTYYIDVDMRFIRHVGEEILAGLVAVRHPGYVTAHSIDLPYENRPQAAAFVPNGWKYRYYAGGFQGGRTKNYLEVARLLDERIRLDEERGIVARWHDESHWNWFLANTRPIDSCLNGRPRELSADYCTPEYAVTKTSKILALVKNHAEVRSA